MLDGMSLLRVRRSWPVATAAVLAVTVVLTVLQFPLPQVRLALWRDPDALAAGQWWRLVTPLFVQYDPVCGRSWWCCCCSPASARSPSGCWGTAACSAPACGRPER
jgi:hypothetical protein